MRTSSRWREQAQDPDPARRISKFVVRRLVEEGVTKDERVGFWAQAAEGQTQGRGTFGQHAVAMRRPAR